MNTSEELSPTVTFSVTIGRNVPSSEPLSEHQWAQFQEDLHFALRDATAIYNTAYGHGNYGQVREACYTVTGTMSGHTLRTGLRPRLALLAHKYGQEAIGLIVQADTRTLVTAAR